MNPEDQKTLDNRKGERVYRQRERGIQKGPGAGKGMTFQEFSITV